MADGFSSVVKINGTEEFVAAIRKMNEAMKVQRSELQLNNAEYGRADKSIEKLSSRNETLKEIFNQQTKQVEEATKALEFAKKEYGENSAEAQKWEIALNKAKAALAVTSRELESNNKILKENGVGLNSWQKGIQGAKEAFSDFGKNFKEQFINNLNNLNFISLEKGIEALGSAIKNIGKYLTDSIVGAAKYADEMLEMSVKTGVATKTLQEFSAVQGLLDVDLNTFTNSLTQITKSINSNKESFQKLGVSITDSSGQFRTSEEVFWDTIDALGNVGNATERDAIAMDLMGKSAQELNPLIAKGSEGFRELAEQANTAGAVLSDKMLENLSSLQDSFDSWGMSVTSVSRSLGAAFAPMVKEITDSAAKASIAFGNLVRKIVEGASGEEIQQAKEEFAASVRALAETIKEQLPLFLETGGMLLKELVNGMIQVLAPHSAEILALLVAVGAAMAAINAAMSLATAGFQTLFSAGIALLGPVISAGFAALAPVMSAAMAMLGTLVQLGIVAIQALAAVAIAAWPVTLAILLAAAITALAIKFWPQISEFFSNMWTKIKEFSSNLWENIKTFFSEHWKDLLLWIVAWPVALIKILVEFWPHITKWLKETWEKISSWAKEIWPKITKWLGDIWNNISTWFSDMASKVGGWISSVWDAIWSKIKEWGSNFLKIGKDLVEGLWNGINDKIQWVKDKISGFCKSVTNWFKNLFGIESPSKLFKNLIGKNLALGLGEGFTDEMKEVSEKMGNSIPTEFETPQFAEFKIPQIESNLPEFDTNELENTYLSLPKQTAQNSNLDSYSNNNLVLALQSALSGMAFEIDGDKIGQLVISKVEKVVFA
jgi:phage-related protein